MNIGEVVRELEVKPESAPFQQEPSSPEETSTPIEVPVEVEVEEPVHHE